MSVAMQRHRQLRPILEIESVIIRQMIFSENGALKFLLTALALAYGRFPTHKCQEKRRYDYNHSALFDLKLGTFRLRESSLYIKYLLPRLI